MDARKEKKNLASVGLSDDGICCLSKRPGITITSARRLRPCAGKVDTKQREQVKSWPRSFSGQEVSRHWFLLVKWQWENYSVGPGELHTSINIIFDTVTLWNTSTNVCMHVRVFSIDSLRLRLMWAPVNASSPEATFFFPHAVLTPYPPISSSRFCDFVLFLIITIF